MQGHAFIIQMEFNGKILRILFDLPSKTDQFIDLVRFQDTYFSIRLTLLADRIGLYHTNRRNYIGIIWSETPKWQYNTAIKYRKYLCSSIHLNFLVNFVLLIVPRRYFCGCSFCFMSWCLNLFLCCWRLMCVYIVLVKLR